jgi:hypothetical protein
LAPSTPTEVRSGHLSPISRPETIARPILEATEQAWLATAAPHASAPPQEMQHE